MGPYILDFYCAEASLCVEVDGPRHEDRTDADLSRDRFLKERGIETYRVSTADMFEADGRGTLAHFEAIAKLCRERSGRDPVWEY